MVQQTTLGNGYYRVGPGKLANAVTWLEMLAPPAVPIAEPLRLVPVAVADAPLYDALCHAIGTPWLWSRAYQPADPKKLDAVFGVDEAGRRIGIAEFVGRRQGDVEIGYFGLVPDATGHGLGRRLMAAALHLAWQSAHRVWLHTCNFDHPAAVRFYVSCGFVPFASGFEIMDDPRLRDELPRDAAPHVPLLPLPAQ